MNRRERLDVLRNRMQAMTQLRALIIEDVPAALPEIQQLRLRISQSRALVLALEVTLQSLYERETPRAERTVDPNAHLNHIESLMLVAEALQLVQQAKAKL